MSFFKDNWPSIAIGGGLGLIFTGTALAVRATIKTEDEAISHQYEIVEKHVSKYEDVYELEKTHPLTTLQKLKLGWKAYVPAGLAMAAGATCVVLGSCEQSKRASMLAAMYGIANTTATELRNELKANVEESTYEKITKNVDKKVADAQARKYAPTKQELTDIYTLGDYAGLCLDTYSGQLFRAGTEQKIKDKITEVNVYLVNNITMSLNDVYDILEIRNTDMGKRTSFDIADGQIHVIIGSTNLYDYPGIPNGTAVMTMTFDHGPKPDYFI